jgi:hypothetical protein
MYTNKSQSDCELPKQTPARNAGSAAPIDDSEANSVQADSMDGAEVAAPDEEDISRWLGEGGR